MIRRHKVLYNGSAAGNGTWVRLDSRYEEDAGRAITIHMNASDTISIEGTVIDAKDVPSLEAIIEDADIAVIESYTGATEAGVTLSSNYTFIRAVKTGTTGTAKVQGYL